MNLVALKYTKALLRQAVEGGMLGGVHADMHWFNRVCVANKALTLMLKNPLIEREKKLAVLQTIFRNSIHDLTRSFFTMVIQRNREALLPAMAQTFLSQHDLHQGIKTAQVTTAFPLSDQLTLQLQHVVQQIVPCQKVVLEQYTDPALIGGYILCVEDNRLDQSLRRKLLTLKKNCVIEGP